MRTYFKVFTIGLHHIKRWIIDEDHICAALFIAIFAFYIPHILIQNNELEKNKAYAVGVIYEIAHGSKSTTFYRYRFCVNGKLFIGREGKGVSKIVIGDSIIIKYDRLNPQNNVLVGYFEYALDHSKLPDTVYYRRQMNNLRRPLNYQ